MALKKVPVQWQTGAGGLGLSVFYCLDTDDITVNLATFFNAIKASFPPVVTWSIPNAGDTIDQNTGDLTGAWTGGTAATIAGTGSAQYFAGTGAYVRWVTGGIRNGRRVRGRTFLCPIINAGADSDGTIGSATLGTLQGAATVLAATNKLQIWGRPHPVPGNDGNSWAVVAGTVPDKTTSLRTRRS